MDSAELIGMYLEHARQAGLAETTRYCRGRSLARLARHLEPVPLIEASPGQLAAWRAGLRPMCSQTIANYVCDVRRFFEWAARAGIRADNPAAELPAAIPSILVARDATKGDYEHMVPMIPLVLRELEAAGMPRQGWMFTRRDGRRGPNSPHTVSALINRHLRECGIDATGHQLRHYFASQAYDVDNDLLAVADMLGHKSLSSVRLYAHISQAKKARIVAAIPVPAPLQAA